MKCGTCQKKSTPNKIHPSDVTRPSPALQPISGGNAPAMAPISVLQVDQRFAGVYQPRYDTMVSNVKSAANLFTAANKIKSAAMHINQPSTKAEPVGTLPDGIGRWAVRFICA